jgi:hypothetical protein
VGGKRARQLLVTHRLEVPRRREVTGATIPQGERRVGHLADQRLHERELPALR